VIRADVAIRDEMLLIGPKIGARPIAHELFLRQLFQLDVASPEQVVDFIGENGILMPPDRSFLPMEESRALAETLVEARRKAEAAVLEPGWRAVPLGEIRFYLKLLRDLVRVLDPLERYAQTDSKACWAWESRWRKAPATPTERTNVLERYLNASLQPYRLRIAEPKTACEPRSYLYPVLCLQIVNYLAEGFDFQTCPICETLFVRREEPGEDKKPWRGKAKCCSRECAVIDAKRSDYARRIKRKVATNAMRKGLIIQSREQEYAQAFFKAHPEEETAYWERRKENMPVHAQKRQGIAERMALADARYLARRPPKPEPLRPEDRVVIDSAMRKSLNEQRELSRDSVEPDSHNEEAAGQPGDRDGRSSPER
jgi:hypothetical protein